MRASPSRRARRDIALVSKIDAGLDQRLRLDQATAPAVVEALQTAFGLAQRLAVLGRRLGVDQVGEPFDGGEVEAAVVEGAARELAGAGGPQARQAAEPVEDVAATTALPPWPCNSAVSSPVKLPGPGSQSTSA